MSDGPRPRCVVVVRAPVARYATPEELAADALWEPPLTLRYRLSRWSMRAIRTGVAVSLAIGLVVGVLWGVPLAAVLRSPGYGPARARLLADRSFPALLGEPLTVARVPRHYRLEGATARYTFAIRGPFGEAAAEVETAGGEVVRVRRRFSETFEERWLRHTRPR